MVPMKTPAVRGMAALLLAMQFSCDNPFATRTPEPPTRSQGTFVTPLTPEAVIANLRNAVTEQNLVNYTRSLADPTRGGRFVYEADPAVIASQPELFADWVVANEQRYFNQLNAVLPTDSTRSLVFAAETATNLGDSALFVENYLLVVRHTQQVNGIPSRYAGQARFTLKRNNLGEWAIHRWADFSTGSLPTWSALKASFGQ